ncbi:phage tail tape measure protein, partial [Lysinibacillus odysseyi]
MANGNIRGITIEINGNTTGLEQALSNVNRESKDLQKELKEVERALKFDPGNAELVRQKQELLTQSIQQTSQKLDTLRQAQSQVQAQFDRGEIGAEQYRAFQRELAQTEGQLSRFQSELSGVQSEQDRLAQNTRHLETFFLSTGTTVDDFSARLGTRLTNAIRDGSASADQLERALNQIGRASLGAGQDLEEFRNALRNADNGAPIDEIRQDLARLRLDAEQATGSVNQLGKGMDDLGDGAKAAAAGVVALGAAAGLSAAQFDNAAGQIQAALGGTKEEAEALEDTAKTVWKDGFGESLEDVSSGLIRVKQNMKRIDGSEIEKVTRDSIALAKTFESDVNEVTRAGNNLMVNFGLSADEAFDLMAKGAQSGLNFSNEMFDNLAEYGPLFANMGYSAEEYFGILQRGSEAGVYNLDYINDVMKEFQIRVKDGSKSTTDSMKELSKSTQQVWKDFLNGKGTVADVAAAVVPELEAMDDQVAANNIGVGLFGTKWEDLEAKAMYAMLNTREGLEGAKGAMDALAQAQEQTFGQRWESFTRTAAASLEPLGKILLDLAEEWLPKVISTVEGVAKWFSDLTPTMQGVTVAIGAIASAIGPLIMVAGSLISSISGIIGLFTSGGLAAGGFGAAIAAIAGPVGIAIGIIAAFVGSVAILYTKWDEFKNLSPVLQGAITGLFAPIVAVTSAIKTIQDAFSPAVEGVKSFGDAVSEETSEAVLSFLDLSNQATVALNQMNWSGQAVTQDMANKITEIYKNMGGQVLAEMQSDHAEQLTQLQSFYAQSSVLSDAQEAEAIAKMQTYHQNRQQVIADGMARANEIVQTATNERREVTLAEQAELDRINAQMKEAAIVHMSESAEEQKVILESLKQEASEITALQAAEVVKNSVKQKDETVAEAQKQYEEALKIIMQQRDETGAITEEQAQLMITEAKRTRDETIKSAEEMHTNVVAEAKAQAGEHVEQVNWTTGEVKSKWQVMKDDTIKKMKDTGAAIKRDWTNAYNDTVKSVGNMVSSVGKFFSDKVKTVQTKMAEVKQKIESKWGEAQAFLKGINLLQIGKDIVNGLITGISNKFDGVKKKVEELAGLIPEWAKDILGIHSPSRVMMELGEWVGIGLANGIKSTEQLNQQVMQSVTDGILAVKKSFKDQAVKIDQDLAKAIRSTNEKANEDIAKIQKTAASKKRALTSEEIAKIHKLRSQAAESILKLEEK